MRLGEYIKSYRDDHDMTMESFASKSGLTIRNLSTGHQVCFFIEKIK